MTRRTFFAMVGTAVGIAKAAPSRWYEVFYTKTPRGLEPIGLLPATCPAWKRRGFHVNCTPEQMKMLLDKCKRDHGINKAMWEDGR